MAEEQKPKTRKFGYREEYDFKEDFLCPWCGSSHLELVGSYLAFEDGEDYDIKKCCDCQKTFKERSDGYIELQEE